MTHTNNVDVQSSDRARSSAAGVAAHLRCHLSTHLREPANIINMASQLSRLSNPERLSCCNTSANTWFIRIHDICVENGLEVAESG
jgi:hypothetical protein